MNELNHENIHGCLGIYFKSFRERIFDFGCKDYF